MCFTQNRRVLLWFYDLKSYSVQDMSHFLQIQKNSKTPFHPVSDDFEILIRYLSISSIFLHNLQLRFKTEHYNFRSDEVVVVADQLVPGHAGSLFELFLS